MLIKNTATVMQNNTICIPKNIREKLNIQPKDIFILTLKNSQVNLVKAPSSWKDLAGIGKKTYQKLGGGEKFLAKERSAWPKK